MDGNMKWGVICFGTECISVRVAETLSQKSKGLANVTDLKRNEGMLFAFRGEHRRFFWMKNVLIPLDIIWMDRNFEIVEISRNQQPCRGFFCPPISPRVKSQYVLELNAGMADKMKLRISNQASFRQS